MSRGVKERQRTPHESRFELLIFPLHQNVFERRPKLLFNSLRKRGDLPMEGITTPSKSDVLCARGGAALKHPGNETYRALVRANQRIYASSKSEKNQISRSIVAAIRKQDGRFLKRNTETGLWSDIGDKAAIEKTSQALREKQPARIQKLKETGEVSAGPVQSTKWRESIYHSMPATHLKFVSILVLCIAFFILRD